MASSGAGVSPEVLDQILAEHFSGNRGALRVCKFLDVRAEGKHASFTAMAVDVSSTGLLLRIVDPTFAPEDEMDQLMPYSGRVLEQFADGVSIAFPGGGPRVAADVVRVTGYRGEGAGSEIITIGCRFRRELSTKECTLIGILKAHDRKPR